MLFGRECETGEHRQRIKTMGPKLKETKRLQTLLLCHLRSFVYIHLHTSFCSCFCGRFESLSSTFVSLCNCFESLRSFNILKIILYQFVVVCYLLVVVVHLFPFI